MYEKKLNMSEHRVNKVFFTAYMGMFELETGIFSFSTLSKRYLQFRYSMY